MPHACIFSLILQTNIPAQWSRHYLSEYIRIAPIFGWMSHQSAYNLLPLVYGREKHNRPTNCYRLTKFRGREVKNILMDLDQSFNMQSKDHPTLMHPHPFYSPSSRLSSPSRSSSQRSLIHKYTKRRRRCEWTCCCKITLALIILILLAWGIAVPLYFVSK